MKTTFLAAVLSLIFVVNFSVNAQDGPRFGEDSVKCVECASLYDSFMKQATKENKQGYVDAYPYWRWMFFNCPKSYLKIYLDGVKLVKHMREIEEDEAKKDLYIDTLMMVYDQRIVHFRYSKKTGADQKGKILGRKGIDHFKYRRKTQLDTSYAILKEAMLIEKNKLEAAVIVKVMQASVLMHKKTKIEDQEFVDNYLMLSDAIAEQLKEKPGDKNLTKANEIVLSLLISSDVAESCDKLVSIFDKIFETRKEVGVLRGIVSVLSAKECLDADVFYNALIELDKVEPSEVSKRNLGMLSKKKGKYSEAVSFYKEAIELSGADMAKGNYYFEIATITGLNLNSYSSGRNYAYTAKDLNSELAPNVYILIATMYAKSVNACGDADLGKKDVYWAAYDMIIKARNYELSEGLAKKVNELSYTFKNNFPVKEKIFFKNLKEGASYTVGGWINETTTVRAKE